MANSGSGTVSVISDSSDTIVSNVTVGSGPYDLSYDSSKGEVFVANAYSRSVSVISDSSDAVVATIGVGSGPLGAAYDSGKGEVFVANTVSGTVSVISDSNNSVVATVPVGASPGGVVYDSGRGELYVLDRGSAMVSVISDADDAVISNVTVGNDPYGAAYDPGRGEVFVANEGDGTVSVILDSPGGSVSVTSSTSPTSSSTSATTSASSMSTTSVSPPSLVQEVWTPKPASAAEAVASSAAVVGAVSVLFTLLSSSTGATGGSASQKTKGILPDRIREWFEDVVESRQELELVEKSGSRLMPTRQETAAYVLSVVVLAVSFSYVKVVTLSQMWALLPFFVATGFIVGFVQRYVSIAYLRSQGVWSENAIWPLGLVLFLFTTFAFRVPFSSPTRDGHSRRMTDRLLAESSTLGVLISLAFAGAFLLLLKLGYPSIGGAGLSMCVIGSFFATIPLSPLSGRDIFHHSKRLWALLFLLTLVVFVAWLIFA